MLYTANITRLDVVKTASKLSKFLYNPLPIHNTAATKAITYLYQTKTFTIKYSKKDIKNYIFIRVNNTAFSDNLVSRKSTKGYLFTLYRGPINWQSIKQKSVTKSSTETELLALSHAATKLIQWQRFFKEVRFNTQEKQVIYCNNTQTIRLLTKSNAELNTKLQHINIYHHQLRQEVQEGKIKINQTPTSNMAADSLTKALLR